MELAIHISRSVRLGGHEELCRFEIWKLWSETIMNQARCACVFQPLFSLRLAHKGNDSM